MTPVQGWSEQDYYRASRAARRAFDRTNIQLQLGLESTEVERADAASAAASVVSSPPAPLTHPGRAHRPGIRTGVPLLSPQTSAAPPGKEHRR